ncbi:hypothetical protein [Pseudonocardia alni]|uniref:hypothetical protein n=1 Tax=Pseudonocardia alni TaxID=33907 RepID=UPI0033E9E1F8
MSPQRQAGRQRAAAQRERLAEQRRAEQRRQRLVRGAFGLGALLVAAGVVLLVLLMPATPAAPGAPAQVPSANGYGAAAAPPWPAPAEPFAGMRAAGLPVSDMSNMARHFHAHLDVIVNGEPVPVPADLGVNPASGQMSALHTHDTTGLVHVESSDPTGRYILGQLFNEWNVALGPTGLGALSVGPGTSLRTFVDGVEVPGNPAAIELREHQQIALIYGPANAPITPPASYDFSGA